MNPVAIRLLAQLKVSLPYRCAFCRDTGLVKRLVKRGGDWNATVEVPCPYCTKPTDRKSA